MKHRKKIGTFRFESSGNSCDVFLNLGNLKSKPWDAIRVEWDLFPPSLQDAETWTRDYFPVVCMKLAELLPGKRIAVIANPRKPTGNAAPQAN